MKFKYPLFALTLLISSSMLFVVQPMVAKMVQPVLGGTPAVWNTAMVFFQALLLGGYFYAHVTTKWLGTRRQAVMHLVILVIGLAFLPIAFDPPADPAQLANPALWLLVTLLIGVGWPFFVISTSAPLLQKWFSTIDHPAAPDPYHLYAASNIGSVFALIAYPFLIEPRIGLALQSTLWMAAYITLCVSVAVCAVILWKSPPRQEDESGSPPASAIPLTWRRRIRWILWAFIPSSMMLGVTTFITTDVAPMPMLWIPPLAIYIFSFIIVFARKTYVPLNVWLTLFPFFFLMLATIFLTDSGDTVLGFATLINFLGLFVFCMVFHGLLASDRPHTDHLTEFYLLMSVGGVLGGTFNALIAPVVFDRLLEYSAILIVAALVFPATAYAKRSIRLSFAISLGLSIAFMLWYFTFYLDMESSPLILLVFFSVFFVPVLLAVIRPGIGPGAVALFAFLLTANHARPQPDELHHERSFFATHQVMRNLEEGHHTIIHGRTMHGLQPLVDGQLVVEPGSYHSRQGPLGQLMEVFEARPERHPMATIGLGAGAVAAYVQPGQRMDFYEIDPVVKEIAQNPEWFTYLSECAGECPVILGDGRLQLQRADDHIYEVIIMDAYSSTAIPVHLLTVEAMEMYLEKLRPDGVLAFHISNRFMDLEPILTSLAAELDLAIIVQKGSLLERESDDYANLPSDWAMVARSPEAFGPLVDDPRWQTFEPRPDFQVWTDDYANVLQILYLFGDH